MEDIIRLSIGLISIALGVMIFYAGALTIFIFANLLEQDQWWFKLFRSSVKVLIFCASAYIVGWLWRI